MTEIYRYLQSQMSEPEVLSLPPYSIALYSKRAPLKSRNEDAALMIDIQEWGHLFLVADGAGGHPQADIAAEIVVSTFAKNFEVFKNQISAFSEDSMISFYEVLEARILRCFDEANAKILSLKSGAGATCVCVHLSSRGFRSYHSGDSLACVFSSQGNLRYRTIGHSPLDLAMESGLLESVDYSAPGVYSWVTSLLGRRDFRLEVSALIDMQRQDRIVLGSDGLFDNIQWEELGRVMQNLDASALAKDLRKTIEYHMANPDTVTPSKEDDVTFIVIVPQN